MDFVGPVINWIMRYWSGCEVLELVDEEVAGADAGSTGRGRMLVGFHGL